MDKIKRYNPHFHPLADDVSFDEIDDGDWVTYDDHAAELAALRGQVERLREALELIAGISGLSRDAVICRTIAKEALE